MNKKRYNRTAIEFRDEKRPNTRFCLASKTMVRTGALHKTHTSAEKMHICITQYQLRPARFLHNRIVFAFWPHRFRLLVYGKLRNTITFMSEIRRQYKARQIKNKQTLNNDDGYVTSSENKGKLDCQKRVVYVLVGKALSIFA